MKIKFPVVFFLMFVALLFSPVASNFMLFAKVGGGDILFEDTKRRRPVLFSHQKHTEPGNQCKDCHPGIFKKKKGSTPTMAMKAMRNGKYCGTCHDGKKAFTVKHSCAKCHNVKRKQQ